MKTQVWICFLVDADSKDELALSNTTAAALVPQLQDDWIGGQAGAAAIFDVRHVPNDEMEATFA